MSLDYQITRALAEFQNELGKAAPKRTQIEHRPAVPDILRRVLARRGFAIVEIKDELTGKPVDVPAEIRAALRNLEHQIDAMETRQCVDLETGDFEESLAVEDVQRLIQESIEELWGPEDD